MMTDAHSDSTDYEIVEEKSLGFKDGQEVWIRTSDGRLVKARLATGTENWKIARLIMKDSKDAD